MLYGRAMLLDLAEAFASLAQLPYLQVHPAVFSPSQRHALQVVDDVRRA